MLVGASVLTGCGSKAVDVHESPSAGGSRSASALPPGQGGDRLVLRWRMSGGMGGVGGPWNVPDFSLYADGTAITAGAPGKGSQLKRYHLKQAVFQQLVADAKKAGLQRSQRIKVSGRIADAMVLTIWMGSARTDIEMPEQHHVPATALWKRLQPEQWPTDDQHSPPDIYHPVRLAVGALDTGEQSAPPDAVAWPLSPLGKGRQVRGRLCTVYSGADATRLRDLASKTVLGARFTSGGRLYTMQIRPLLPDETSCDALA
ncbi:hypothetical protein EBO15_34385 [Actinomadura harenae]|uniref:Uncharacterized protein n=1 Tax=Actinomadura harenae TaxID=2483351 RepID=A0A3M2LLH6_9ACTN|nr:hypothetical protein EBO15_34385 [Actinomadura harenae]